VANLDGLDEVYRGRYRFVRGDICDFGIVSTLMASGAIDTIIHLAAESHVDRSIDDPLACVRTNVLGTAILLDVAAKTWRGRPATGAGSVRFHHVSTDEVFGSLETTGHFDEDSKYAPNSPYSASKAASDHLVRAWGRTFGLSTTVSTCSNNYGPYHFPEKLIPLTIMNALAGQPLPVYGDGSNVRDWLHVIDHARAIDMVVRRGAPGRTYCIGGGSERSNVDTVRSICRALDALRPDPGGPYERLITFVPDRPGHDLRYAIDSTRIASELGWSPSKTFAIGIKETVCWFLEHQDWLQTIRSTRYAGSRLGMV
jgi:dTDP-glucose 4,6-dehydratase